jgi:hypothetical protein
VSGFSRTLSIQQPDRTLDRRGTQVHVPLRRDQILMPGELLNRPRRRAPHREMRAERVPQSMHTARAERGALCRACDVVRDHVLRER